MNRLFQIATLILLSACSSQRGFQDVLIKSENESCYFNFIMADADIDYYSIAKESDSTTFDFTYWTREEFKNLLTELDSYCSNQKEILEEFNTEMLFEGVDSIDTEIYEIFRGSDGYYKTVILWREDRYCTISLGNIVL